MKIYINKNKFNFSAELLILAGMLQKNPEDSSHNFNKHGESRFGDIVVWCKQNITYSEKIEDSDICVLPYKFKGPDDPYLFSLLEHGKHVWCFYNDDDERTFSLSEKIKLFRTSVKKSKMIPNEYILPPLVTDRFDGIILKNTQLSIGFVGQTGNGRKKYLDVLARSEFKTNFILRKGFWAPGIDRKKAVSEYFNNIQENLFTFCYRGAGNFSYRFYETLMMGRIPIMVTTDSCLPFEDTIDYSKHIVIIPEEKLNSPRNIISWVLHFYKRNQNNLVNIQLSNRELWEKYFSPIGYIKKITHIK